ncbi:apolipo protein O-domain-containing protein [Cryomyces antarcticus]
MTGAILYPKNTVHAESTELTYSIHDRKPIYDDTPSTPYAPPSTPSVPDTTTPPPRTSISTSPTPTDRLAAQIKHTRLFLHAQAVTAENKTNDLMSRFLHLESSFTSTIASLAPPKESGEHLLPGGIYVLVAAMAGSIVTRNRNILLRATVPAAVGIGAAYAVLPLTTRNVGNLVWSYEERYPVIRDNHLRLRNQISHVWQTGKAHSQMGLAMAEDKVEGVREAVEEWVRKGK